MKRMFNDSSVRWSKKKQARRATGPSHICCLQDKRPNLLLRLLRRWSRFDGAISQHRNDSEAAITITPAMAKINICAVAPLAVRIHPQIALSMRLIEHDRVAAVWIILPWNKSDILSSRPISSSWAFVAFFFFLFVAFFPSLEIQLCINVLDKWNVLNLRATAGALMWSLF